MKTHEPSSSAESGAGSRLRRVLLVVNPGARRSSAALPVVLNEMARAGVACEVVKTEAPRHATSLVRGLLSTPRVHPFDAIFTLGGDGTAMEVATALAEFPDAPPLGIVPLGTANVIARSVGIRQQTGAAIRQLVNARTVRIDLGRIQGGPSFAIGLGVGLDAAMISGASARAKHLLGYLAYALSALRAGLRRETFDVQVEVDGHSHDLLASSVLVANFGSVLGDLLCFGECVSHQDGVLDVCIYSPKSMLDSVRIFWKMLRGGVGSDKSVQILSGSHVRLSTSRPRAMQADGELLGLTPVEIEIQRGAIQLLVPDAVPARSWLRRRPSLSLPISSAA